MTCCAWLAMVIAVASPAVALVNPQLQPFHLYEMYNVVLSGRVTAIDAAAKSMTVQVMVVHKGVFAPKQITIVGGDEVGDAVDGFSEGMTLVAFVGKERGRHENELLFYAGSRTDWQTGASDAADPAKWTWIAPVPKGDEGCSEMWGTFNGAGERLSKMMADMKAGRLYYPAVATDKFREDQLIHKFGKGVKGVAAYDVDGDGKLDIYACCEDGNRLFLQTAGCTFADATDKLGLAGVRSSSCSFAGVRGDGRADLLAGGVIYLAPDRPEQPYRKSDLLPPDADKDVLSSAFADINADGYPDVVVSRAKGGLHVYMNPGAPGGVFADATAACGLGANGGLAPPAAGGNGLFAAGDWNDDGRCDLFYAVGKGLLLVQDAMGRFAGIEHGVSLAFDTDGEKDTGMTGGAMFAPLWRPDSCDLVVPMESSCRLLTHDDGGRKVLDVTRDGNELTDSAFRTLAALAEDLNADGYVDLLLTSSSPKQPNVLYVNRGYGSFMRVDKYRKDVFKGPSAAVGAWGASAGDFDGDGANDLVLGGEDGSLTLLLNDVLAGRKPAENPTYHQKKLLQTALLAVRLTGKTGLLGARLTLADADGRVVARRCIGWAVLTGCRGPDAVSLAVRESGKHVLTIRYSDGAQRRWDVDLLPGKLTTLCADRQTGTPVTAASAASDN